MPITKKAADCFNAARRKLIEGAKYLHEIKAKELWSENYESFSDYLQEECRISDSFASKLVQVFEHYALKGGVDPVRLEEVDTEKLYMAMKLPGTPEKQFSQALTLTRGELKNEQLDPNDECKHPNTAVVCTDCHKRV